MFIVPTWKRPHKLRRLMQALKETGTTAPGLVFLQGEEQKTEYLEVFKEMPANWTWIGSEGNVGWVKALNFLVRYKPQESWYGVINDDHVPITKQWDQKMLSLASPWGMVTCLDNDIEIQWRASGPLILGGELVRACGFFMPPCTWHICGDDWWQIVGKVFSIWRVAANVQVNQDSPIFSGEPPDETHHSSYGNFFHQLGLYHRWLAQDGGNIMERLRIIMTAKGVLPMHEAGRFSMGAVLPSPQWYHAEGPTRSLTGG